MSILNSGLYYNGTTTTTTLLQTVQTYIDPAIDGFVSAGQGFVGMISDKMTNLTAIYNSNMNMTSFGSNVDGTGSPLYMPLNELEFVAGLRTSNPAKYKILLDAANSMKTRSDDENTQALETFFKTNYP